MTILVPIDFSGMAAEAASYAAALARKLDAHMILLHAIPPYDVWWTGPDKDLIEEAQLRQETVKKSLVEQGVDEARVENHIVGCFPIGPCIRDLIVKSGEFDPCKKGCRKEEKNECFSGLKVRK